MTAHEQRRNALAQMAAEFCGATSANAFLNAVTWWQEQIEELERAGRCVACGWSLNGQTTCRECGREQ